MFTNNNPKPLHEMIVDGLVKALVIKQFGVIPLSDKARRSVVIEAGKIMARMAMDSTGQDFLCEIENPVVAHFLCLLKNAPEEVKDNMMTQMTIVGLAYLLEDASTTKEAKLTTEIEQN